MRYFVVRGSGTPLRQFIYSQDLGELTLKVLDEYNEKEPIILSVDEKDEVTIGDVARLIARNYDYEHRMVFDKSFADGQYKKTASNGKLRKYWKDYQFTGIEEGIQRSVKWFIDNFNIARK